MLERASPSGSPGPVQAERPDSESQPNVMTYGGLEHNVVMIRFIILGARLVKVNLL
jgi:hypothetical protein